MIPTKQRRYLILAKLRRSLIPKKVLDSSKKETVPDTNPTKIE